MLGFGFVPTYKKGEKGKCQLEVSEKGWKTLFRLGVDQEHSYSYSRSRMGTWAVACSPVLRTTITVARLQKRGCESLFSYYIKIAPFLNEPLYTRTVRTVV
jgi:hypothetical protein